MKPKHVELRGALYAKANSLRNAVDDALESLAAENARLRRSGIGDRCDVCDKPQWVLPDGSHACATFPELQAENVRLRGRVERLERIRKAANCVVIAAKRDRWPEHGYLKALLEALQESEG